MNKRFTLWASNWTDNYSTDKFSIGRACFLSSAPNSHELSISPEVLKQCAGSILGCFLVADVDTDAFGNKDFTTHVPQEKIIGYAPVEQTIEYEQDDDGIVRAYATFVISKMYAGEEVSIFDETGNLQNVSVEMMVSTEEDDPNTVTEFDIFGLTVLGKDVNGSCPSACMSITRFSVEEAIEAFHNKEVIKMEDMACKTQCADSEEEMECKKCADDSEDMCKTKCAEDEADMAGCGSEEDMTCKRCAEPTDTADMSCGNGSANEDMACKRCAEPTDVADMSCGGSKSEDMCKTKCAEDEAEMADDSEDMACKKCADDEADMADCGCGGGNTEEEDLACKNMEELSSLRAKCAELAAQVESNNNVIMEQERELAELRSFKEQAQCAQLAADVDAVLAEVSSTFSEEQMAEYRQEAIAGGIAQFDAWSNKVKAAAFSAIKDSKKVAMSETLWGGMMFMSAPVTNVKESHGLWD